MKTKEEIVKNWLPRYTGRELDDFDKYILLTNFDNYMLLVELTRFRERRQSSKNILNISDETDE